MASPFTHFSTFSLEHYLWLHPNNSRNQIPPFFSESREAALNRTWWEGATIAEFQTFSGNTIDTYSADALESEKCFFNCEHSAWNLRCALVVIDPYEVSSCPENGERILLTNFGIDALAFKLRFLHTLFELNWQLTLNFVWIQHSLELKPFDTYHNYCNAFRSSMTRSDIKDIESTENRKLFVYYWNDCLSAHAQTLHTT